MDSPETMPESRLYESLSLDAQQTVYDIAAWEYVDYLRGMTAAEAAAHFKRVAWIESYQPEAATRCPTCGETCIELKWAKDHTEWQCLEPTCRNQWRWRGL